MDAVERRQSDHQLASTRSGKNSNERLPSFLFLTGTRCSDSLDGIGRKLLTSDRREGYITRSALADTTYPRDHRNDA